MGNILKISLEGLQQEHLGQLFDLLNRAFDEVGVHYYVLGALARDIWLETERKQVRATRDVDFAVYVEVKEMYEQLQSHLTNEYGFERVKHAPARLRTPFGYTIDLIPFGIESIDEKVILDESNNRPIYINGLEEVFEHATAIARDEEMDIEFRVATLPGILLLKLIAYDDRPERRTQDPGDIRDIILNYFDVKDRMIYEHHNDLFGDDFDKHKISAVVIGRQMKDILKVNKRLRERILGILSAEQPTQQRMTESMADLEITEQQVKYWFSLMAIEIQI